MEMLAFLKISRKYQNECKKLKFSKIIFPALKVYEKNLKFVEFYDLNGIALKWEVGSF